MEAMLDKRNVCVCVRERRAHISSHARVFFLVSQGNLIVVVSGFGTFKIICIFFVYVTDEDARHVVLCRNCLSCHSFVYC